MVYRAPVNEDEGDLLTGSRACRECGKRKPMAEFFWTENRRYRVRICSSCSVDRARARREANRKAAAWRSHVNNLRTKYGMTEADFRMLWERQDGCCAICRDPLDRPHVDHCHRTGRVRGLLCFRCNTAIGKLRDSPELLRAAADYLEREPPEIQGCERRKSAAELTEIRSLAARRQHATDEGQRHLRQRPRGEANSNARLSDAAANEIRTRYFAGGVSQRALAEEFGCSQGLVSRIVLGKVRAAA